MRTCNLGQSLIFLVLLASCIPFLGNDPRTYHTCAPPFAREAGKTWRFVGICMEAVKTWRFVGICVEVVGLTAALRSLRVRESSL